MPVHWRDVRDLLVLTWKEMRRDVFAILLLCLDGYTVPDAVEEADNLIEALDNGILGATEPQ